MTPVEVVAEHGTRQEDAARYHALFNGSLDAIYLSRANGRIMRANPSFLRLFGYTMGQLSDMSAEDFYADPEDRRRFQAEISADGAVQDFETRLRRRDGELRICLITATARTSLDGATEYQGIIRDITDRRREQAELACATEALRRSNAELEQFAYVASHDLQEPLRKIRSFGDRLERRAGEQLDEQNGDYLRRMVSAAARMQSLIDNLLAYSRVASRGAVFEPVDLDEVLAEVLNDLEPQIADARGEIECHPLPPLRADPHQMRQLFQNLVSNALKYRAPDRDGVRIEIRGALLDGAGSPVPNADARGGASAGAERAEKVRITVRDDGIGFEQEYAERIFELFQRLHGRGTYDGTGIGLGICRRIVHRHGGSIRAEGAPGEGAVFEILLPLMAEGEEEGQ